MLYIVTRDRGGRDDVMRKSPIKVAIGVLAKRR